MFTGDSGEESVRKDTLISQRISYLYDTMDKSDFHIHYLCGECKVTTEDKTVALLAGTSYFQHII